MLARRSQPVCRRRSSSRLRTISPKCRSTLMLRKRMWASSKSIRSSRSEERRVGKECRSRWSAYHEKKNKTGWEQEDDITLVTLQRADGPGAGGERVLARFEVHSATGNERYVFVFQAEDGIRDATVTGVQTCALPI